MTTTGTVVITTIDNGGSNIAVPSSKLVMIAGCSSAGTAGAFVATASQATITSTFGYGPLPELASLLVAAGATVICCRLASTTPGVASAVTHTGTGLTAMTVTGAAYDSYLVSVKCVSGGTIGTAGVSIQISLDAGRTYGPIILLGTATTYTIPHTNLALSWTVATIVAGDVFTFSSVEPLWQASDVTAWIAAMGASTYAQAGWGRTVLCGDVSGANASTFNTNMTTLQTGQSIFSRLICNARDSHLPVAWAGAGETDAVWQAAVIADFSAVSASRVCPSAGHYNMPSAIANVSAGAPRFRRPLSWALLIRKIAIPVQRLSSEVVTGALASIVVDPTSDPSDGFIYHDERNNPGLDAARFTSAWTRVRQPLGYYIRSENLASAPGSDFQLLAQGDVFDNFCNVLFSVGTPKIDSIVRTNPNGTIYENDARDLETTLLRACEAAMSGQYQPANTSIVIDRAYNIMTNSKVRITGSVGLVGYIREIDMALQITNPLSAAA